MWYIHTFVVHVRSSRKDKNKSKKSDDTEMTEAASIQGSPTYAATTQAVSGNGNTGPELQYAYARTGPVKVSRIFTKHVAMYPLYHY